MVQHWHSQDYTSGYTPWSSNFFLYMTVKMHIVKNDLMSAVVSMSQVAILLLYLCKEMEN